ncbi:MAG: efflux RND transporter periplasmic adaptor subunit [Pseudomonadota bacterium]
MCTRWVWISLVVCICAIAWFGTMSQAREDDQWTPSGKQTGAEGAAAKAASEESARREVHVEAVVVNPFRSANVGSQVGGIIERVHYDEGDLVQEGQVIAEIGSERYQLAVQRAEERVNALKSALKRAEEELRIKRELFELDGASRQDVAKAEAEAEGTAHRVGEAAKELDLARYDLRCCRIKAPFTGYIAVRYKQPDEPVDRLEKIFAIVDSSKVHAVANVPEMLVSEFKKGTEAFFLPETQGKFKGTVDRVGKLIDPKSRTKRVYLLIDNAEGSLEVGTNGSLLLSK